MSLRSEYTHTSVIDPLRGTIVVVSHWGKVVSETMLADGWTVDDQAEEDISAHMERVTRILEGAPIDPEKAEEHDRLAHKADHDNQCERDLS